MLNIEQPHDLDGYVIVPLKKLDPEIIKTIQKNRPDVVISKKEMISMYTSTVLEINKGDNSKKSLNVKLYNCLASFAQKEMDRITNRILGSED